MSHAQPPSRTGQLLVFSGPSGSGKSTLARRLIDGLGVPVRFSVSATSRAPRPGEVDGRDYYFLSDEEFERRARNGDFLEHAEVYGRRYGTLREPVERALAAGEWLLLDIDPQGHRSVKAIIPEAVSFFIRAPRVEDYRDRLLARGSESPEQLARRLDQVRDQLAAAREYDHQIVNESLPQALRTLTMICCGLSAPISPPSV